MSEQTDLSLIPEMQPAHEASPDVWDSLRETSVSSAVNVFSSNPAEEHYRQMIRRHKAWLDSITHECPNPYRHYRIGVYGHFCLKSDQYVRQTWDGALYLTEYAKKHINECCLSFRPGRRANHACYEYGLAARAKAVPVTDRYNSRYSFDAEPGTEASRKEISSFLKDAELWADLERHFTDDFSGSLQMIMEAKGITQSELSLRFNVDRKIVYKLLNTPQPSIPHIVAACIALDVPYCIAETLLRKAGHVLRNIPVHNVYRMMLSNTAGLTVDKCNEILTSRHYPSLFQNS